jgi:zinc D-Ala-D-Ala carboxypeptidase
MAPRKSSDSTSSTVQRAMLAIQIIVNPNITLATGHVSGVKDNADATDDVVQSIFLMRAHRSCYENAPCGDVGLSLDLMRGMIELAKVYQYEISEIAGGSHSKGSRHYAGVAMDVTKINGLPVSSKNKLVAPFMRKCKSLGATEVLGPGAPGHSGHVHAAWPRPKSG